MTTSTTTSDIRNTVDYWITVLLLAMQRGDLAAAAAAQKRLHTCHGVNISFGNLLPDQRESKGV
jgi:hypothetical protein